MTGVTGRTGNGTGIDTGVAVKAFLVAGMAFVADIGNVRRIDARLRVGRFANVVFLMATGADRRFGVAAFHFVEVTGVDIAFDVALVALGADVDDFLFVFGLRHDVFFRLEMGVVTSGADRVVAVVFLILLIMIALLVFGSLCRVTTLADNFHAQVFLRIVRAVATLAIGDVFLTFAFEHFVEVFHPGGTYDFVARFAIDRLIFAEMRHVFEICPWLIVAVDAGHCLVDRTMKCVAINKD